MGIQSHRDLIVWQKAMDLAVDVYGLCQQFPKTETYRMVDQMLLAVTSVPANIAEGFARDSAKDYARFLAIAKGSPMEVETFLTLSVRLSLVIPVPATVPRVRRSFLTLSVRLSLVIADQTERCHLLNAEISKMLTSLRRKVQSSSAR